RASRAGTGLRIVVEDTGPGFERSRRLSRNGIGLGLENVRRRLELCYGPAASLEIESGETGSKVAFVVPEMFASAESLPQTAVEV
ncbi:MAG: hypothetical protein JO091_12185, partial [Acidobacteriaceae bacterium]|nr:hypothetical protein [Acidobacteriaceae bacterium]